MPAPRFGSQRVPKQLGGGSRENLVGGSDDSGSEHSGSSRSLDSLDDVQYGSNRSLNTLESDVWSNSDEDMPAKVVPGKREKRLSRGSTGSGHESDLEVIDERPDAERIHRGSVRDVFGDLAPSQASIIRSGSNSPPKEPESGPVTAPLSFKGLVPNAQTLEAHVARGGNRLRILRTSSESPLAEEERPDTSGGYFCCGRRWRGGAGRRSRKGREAGPIRGAGQHEESDAPAAATQPTHAPIRV